MTLGGDLVKGIFRENGLVLNQCACVDVVFYPHPAEQICTSKTFPDTHLHSIFMKNDMIRYQ